LRVVVISRGDFVHTLPFLEDMQERGWDVHFAELSPLTVKVGEGVTAHRCYLGDQYPKLLNYVAASRHVRRVCKKIQPDLLWGHYVSSAGTVAWLSGFRPYALTVHGSDVLYESQKWSIRQLLKRMFRSAALIHTVSPQIDDRIGELGTARTKLRCLPFGIDVDAIQMKVRDEPFGAPLRLVCTRSIQNFVYDMPTIIRAMAELKRRNVAAQLTFSGTGALEQECKDLAIQLGLDDCITFMGGYTSDQLNGILHDHDIYVSASLSDGASLSLLEAMASGIYPVVSDIPANRVWLEDVRAGFFPPGDAIALADRIEGIASQGQLPTDGRQNRAHVEASGNRTQNMSRVLDSLETVVNRSKTV
jgi:glycosyltransferase involved in cell wall biosynthesis